MLIARDYLGDVLHDDCIRKDMDACEAILPAAEGLCLVIDILQKEAFGIKKPSQKGKKKSQKKE